MPTNKSFNFYNANNSQGLYSRMVRQAIKFAGIDFLYMPRTMLDFDRITGKESIATFEKTYPIECYVDSYNGFDGMGAFMNQFGVQVENQMTLIMHRISFEEEVTRIDNTLIRPKQYDLLYFPIGKKLFQIDYIDPRDYFYQLGDMPTYKLHISLFEYSTEVFNTGIEDIDILQKDYSFDIYDYSLLDENGDVLIDENSDALVEDTMNFEEIDPFSDNDVIHEEADDTIDWSEGNQFIKERY